MRYLPYLNLCFEETTLKAMFSLLLLLAATTLPVYAEDPAVPPVKIPSKDVPPSVIFPLVMPSAKPDTPPPIAVDIPLLPPRIVYVVQSPVPFVLKAVPRTAVNVAYDSGPIKVKGIFIDGKNFETRTYADGYIATVDAMEGPLTRVTLSYIPLGAAFTSESDIVDQLIDAGNGAQPPPVVVPPVVVPPVVVPPVVVPVPDPTPADPTAISLPDGNRVVFITETSANQTKDQLNVLNDPDILAYLQAKCVKGGPKQTPEWRQFDPDVDISKIESPTIAALWQAVLADLKQNPRPLPLILVTAGGKGHMTPLPNNKADALAYLKKYLGD